MERSVDTLAADSTAARVIPGLEALQALVGSEVAVSDWVRITRERIAAFADATDDHQWIHLDEARAKRESPYGGIVAHGYLTLSLMAKFRDSAIHVEGVGMAINYGVNRVRFPAPVRAGGRVRAVFVLAAYEPIEGGAQVTWNVTVTEEGAPKPCCVAELVTRLYRE
jgi:acyl dehydratase